MSSVFFFGLFAKGASKHTYWKESVREGEYTPAILIRSLCPSHSSLRDRSRSWSVATFYCMPEEETEERGRNLFLFQLQFLLAFSELNERKAGNVSIKFKCKRNGENVYINFKCAASPVESEVGVPEGRCCALICYLRYRTAKISHRRPMPLYYSAH